MTREQLKERVRKLPMQPGVYMHKDKISTTSISSSRTASLKRSCSRTR